MRKDVDELRDLLEVLFENLDTRKFEDSYVSTVVNAEPNEHFKMTVSDKIEYLQTELFGALDELEVLQNNLKI